MRAIRAQLIQVTRTRFIWVCSGICAIVLAYVFYQYTVNTGSGVGGPDAGNPATLVCLFLLLMMSILGILPAVATGSYLGGKDDDYSTAGNMVVSGGRLRTLGTKLAALAVISVLVVLAVVLLGVVMGLVRAGGWGGETMRHLPAQIGLAFVVLFMTGLLALVVAVLARGVAVANIACYVALAGQMFLPTSASRVVQWVSPMAYVQGLIPAQFPQLANLPGVTVLAGSGSVRQGLIWGAVVLAFELALLVGVALRREVRS
ncbi:MAG: hypothetical protein FWC46_01815 [Actinomycetia bacterium]|nr:hypothetical protein [Actinomycetes bacterium]